MTFVDSSESSRASRKAHLLSLAAALPASERDLFLSAQCGDDHALRQDIYAHLLAESRGLVKATISDRPGPVTNAVKQALAGSMHDRRVELLGKVIGDYRLTAIIGAGGVGTVYLGERADRQYSAQVAIKVVANTDLNHEIQRRFAAERQILANLNHPNIGRLLDAGETVFDEPFLVMEYVHGEPIDRYCDNQRLTVIERIRLFLQVCDAVQYAHRNLIVHRDLKPGNILVSNEGIPKLLDFGIAKLLDESAQAISQENVVAHTRVNDRLLTPEYASPEQIRGLSVTTASDVYSLGVVLYELLTGTRPYAVNSVNQLELERSVCIQDAIKPSQRIGVLANQIQVAADPNANDLQLIASARNVNFKKLEHQLQGDLDAIVLRALRKEPEHRYSSVEHLIDDLNCHLNQEPVEARQGNRWYYTQRFVRRHTLGVITSTTALASLIAVAIILSIQAHRLTEQRDIAKQQRDKATQESQRAETVSNFMLDVFTATDPFQSQDKQVTAKDLLDNAARKIESKLNDQPEVKARLLEAIGVAYLNQGQSGLAIQYLHQALDAQYTLSTIEMPNSAIIPTLNQLVRAYTNLGDFENANRAIQEARKQYEITREYVSVRYLETLVASGGMETKMSRPVAAQLNYSDALEIARQLYGNEDTEVAGILMALAQVMLWQSNYTGAEPLIGEAVRIYHVKYPTKHPDRLSADVSFGELLYHQGKFDEAITLIKQVLSDQKTVFGDANPQLINTYNLLSRVYLATGQLGSAEEAAQKGLSIATASLGESNFLSGAAHSAFSNVLIKQKKYSAAYREASLSLKILKQGNSSDHQYVASAEYLLASSLIGQRRFREAEPILRENISRWARAEAPAWRAARSESLLGTALLQLHRNQDAAVAINGAFQVLSAKNCGADFETMEIARKRVEEYNLCVSDGRENSCQLSQ